MLRHLLTINRLMYHQHLLTRSSSETIKKIYMKQKQDCVKGDWFQLLKKDFMFIGVEMDEQDIIATPKNIYKEKIKKLVTKAAFQEYLRQKEGKKKLDEKKYESFSIQPYLKLAEFSMRERNCCTP